MVYSLLSSRFAPCHFDMFQVPIDHSCHAEHENLVVPFKYGLGTGVCVPAATTQDSASPHTHAALEAVGWHFYSHVR